MFLKEVVKAVLILRSDKWLMTPLMGQALVGFQHMVSIRITGRQSKRKVDESW